METGNVSFVMPWARGTLVSSMVEKGSMRPGKGRGESIPMVRITESLLVEMGIPFLCPSLIPCIVPSTSCSVRLVKAI